MLFFIKSRHLLVDRLVSVPVIVWFRLSPVTFNARLLYLILTGLSRECNQAVLRPTGTIVQRSYRYFYHISRLERVEKHAVRLLSSIERHFLKPRRQQASRSISVKNTRQEWRKCFAVKANAIAAHWTSSNVFIVTNHYVILWSTNHGHILWNIPRRARAIALNNNGNVILWDPGKEQHGVGTLKAGHLLATHSPDMKILWLA